MRNIFNGLIKRNNNSITSVNAARRIKHAVFIGIIVITLIIVTVSKLPKTEEAVPETEDPIESYDKITEIEIVFDEETTAENITDTEDSADGE